MQKRTVLKVGRMHCAGCVNSIQRFVSRLDGVNKVEVNLANERAVLEYDSTKISLDVIEKTIEDIGYEVVYEKILLTIEGISDSSDAQRLEQNISRIEGIKSVSVNYGSSQINVEYNPALVSVTDIRKSIAEHGYNVLGETEQINAHDIEAKKLRNLFFIGIIFTIPAVLFSYPEVFGFMPLSGTNAAAYLAFAAASIVQFVIGSRFYAGALRIAKMKSANMDTLVVLGTTAAYVFSAFNTFPTASWHHIYYDASSLVITFIILGKYLELKTKGKTSSIIRKILELQPKTAKVRKGDVVDGNANEEIVVPVELIQSGDIIVVRPGERMPVDSVVVQGESTVDESMVTGESRPIHKKVGDSIVGGTINKESVLFVKATNVGANSFLSQVVRLVEDAMGKKPAIQKLVDKVAGYFAYAVMIIALATFGVWYFGIAPGIASAAIIPAVAILVVACPCALGLATPTAIMVGMGKSASNGVIFKSGDAIEMLSKVSVVIFDKTGTLTRGKPVVTDVIEIEQQVITAASNGETESNDGTNVLLLAASAENYSEHPLAKAIVEYAKNRGLEPKDVVDFEATPGRGVTAKYKNNNNGTTTTIIRVGSPDFIKSAANTSSGNIIIQPYKVIIDRLQDEGKTVVVVSSDDKLVGVIGLLDTPKPGAEEAIAKLQSRGIETVMLTGDNKRTAEEIANIVGIKKVFADVLPSDKVDVIKKIQQQGNEEKSKGGKKKAASAVVAMVGDGINDAPALVAADVGIAIGSGTDLAIEAGGVVLIRDDLRDVASAIEIAKKTVSKIRQNLAYAFLYNAILIPVAAMGLLYPALAGLAMATSSVSVTLSSLALKRQISKK